MTTLFFFSLMVAGTFFLGVRDVGQKKYLTEGMNDQLLLGVSYVLGSLLLSPLLLFFGIPQIQPGFLSAFVATVALNVVSQNVFIRAFKEADASLIAPLRLLSPPFTILTGFLILGEIPTLIGVVGILVTIVGLWVLIADTRLFALRSIGDSLSRKAVVLGIFGALLFAVSIPFDKKVVLASSGLLYAISIQFVVGFLTLLGNYAGQREFRAAFLPALSLWRGKLIFLAVCGSMGTFLTNQALNYSLVAYAASVKRLWSFWTVLLAGKFLREQNVRGRLIATGVMLVGLIITAVFG